MQVKGTDAGGASGKSTKSYTNVTQTIAETKSNYNPTYSSAQAAADIAAFTAAWEAQHSSSSSSTNYSSIAASNYGLSASYNSAAAIAAAAAAAAKQQAINTLTTSYFANSYIPSAVNSAISNNQTSNALASAVLSNPNNEKLVAIANSVYNVQQQIVNAGGNASNTSSLGLQQYSVVHTPNYATATGFTTSVEKNYFPAIIDCSVNDGVQDYGVISLNRKQYKDGTVCLCDADGTIVLTENNANLSEDYRAQLQEFKDKALSARDEWKLSRQFQELAAEGANNASHTYGDDQSTIADIIVGAFHSLVTDGQRLIENYNWKDYKKSHPEAGYYEWVKYVDSLTPDSSAWFEYSKTWAYNTALGKYIQDECGVRAKAEKYQNSGSYWQDAMRNTLLNDTTMSQREKAYLAYRMVQGYQSDAPVHTDFDITAPISTGITWLYNAMKNQGVLGEFMADTILMDVLPSFGELVDVATGQANIKAAVAYLDHLYDLPLINTTDQGDGDFWDYQAAIYRNAWANEGRANYNFDTGIFAVDMILEMITDPGNIAKLAKKVVTSVGDAKTINAALDSGAYVGTEMRRALKSGNTDAVIAQLKAQGYWDAEIARIMQVIQPAMEYNLAYKISSSLKTAEAINDAITKACWEACSLSPVWTPIFAKIIRPGFKIASDAVESVASYTGKQFKAMTDAIAELFGSRSVQEVHIDSVTELMDYYQKNIAGLKLAGEEVDFLSASDKEFFIAQVYKQDLEDLRINLEGDVYIKAEQQLVKDTIEVLEKNGLEGSDFYHAIKLNTKPSYTMFGGEIDDWAKEASDTITDQIKQATKREDFAAVFETEMDIDFGAKMKDMQDTLEVAKNNERIIQETIYANKEIKALTDPQGTLGYVQQFSQSGLKNSANPTAARDVTRYISSKSAGVQNYKSMRECVLNSNYIPESLKSTVLDRMCSPSYKRYVSQTFASGTEGLTTQRIASRARSMAVRLLEESQSLDARLARADWYTDLFKDCDDVMDYAIKIRELAGTEDAIGYRIQYDANGVCTKLALSCEEFNKVYDLTDLRVLNDLDQDLMKLRSTRAHLGRKADFVGFNCKSSTTDLDHTFMVQMHNHNVQAGNFFRSSRDLGDEFRIRDHKMVYYPESAVDELSNEIQHSINNWLRHDITDNIYGMHSTFSLTGLDVDDIRRALEICEDNSYVGKLTKAEQNYLDTLTKSLQDTLDTLNEAHRELTDGLGAFRYSDDFMAKLKDLGPEVGASKIYEYKVIDRWYDTTDMDVAAGIRVYDNAKAIQAIRDTYKYEVFFEGFQNDIDALYSKVVDAYTNPKNYNSAMGRNFRKLGIIKADGSFAFKATTPMDRAAVMQWLKNTEGFYWINDSNRLFQKARYTFLYALEDPYNSIVRPTQQFFNPDEILKGSIDNPNASFNKLMQLERMADDIDKHMGDWETVRQMRVTYGLDGELAMQRSRYLNRISEPYKRMIDAIKREARADANNKMYSSKSTNPYVRYWENGPQKTGVYEDLGRAEYVLDRADAHRRLSYVQALDDKMFTNFIDQNNGLMYVDLNFFSKEAKNSFVESMSQRKLSKKYTVEITDDYVKVIGTDHSGKIKSLSPAQGVFTRKEASAWLNNFGGADNKWVGELYDWRETLRESNDVTFTYGMPIANSRQNVEWFVNRYFPELRGEDLKIKSTNGGYFSAYFGGISGMIGEGSYTSGDYLTNLVNSYQRTIKNMDNMDLLAGVTVRTNEVLQLCGGDTKLISGVLNQLYEDGMSVVVYDDIKGIFREATARDIAKGTNNAILSANEAMALIKHSVDVDWSNAQGLAKVLKSSRKVESMGYLRWMLNSSPGTWMNNWKDSTIKAALQEGDGYFSYVRESIGSLNKIREAEKRLAAIFEDGWGPEQIDYLVKKGRWNFDIDATRMKQWYAFKNSTMGSELPATLKEVFTDKNGRPTPFSAYFKFNEKMFNSAETVNRWAIFMKEMDENGNFGKAYRAIAESQFDYAKGMSLKVLDTVLPFSTFQLKNYGFWLVDMWKHDGAAHGWRQLTRLYEYDEEDTYWSEEMLRLRAWIDSCNFEAGSDELNEYNQFTDFMGSKQSTAKEYGWIKFGDKVWYKMGVSWLDAYSGFEGFLSPDGISDGLWSPLKVLKQWLDTGSLMETDFLKGTTEFFKTIGEHGSLQDWYNKYGFETLSTIPVIGTIIYQCVTGYRNKLLWDRVGESPDLEAMVEEVLSVLFPSQFAPKRQTVDKTYYYEREIGYNWYDVMNRLGEDSEEWAEWKANHRYIMGLSYIPSWQKSDIDPSAYINTFGRFKQLLGDSWTNDEIYDFMMNSGMWWAWEDETHRKVVLKAWLEDDDAFEELIKRLGYFGWSRKEAMDLIGSTSKYWKLKIEYGDDWYKHWNGTYTSYTKYSTEQWNNIWQTVWGANSKEEAWAYLRKLGFSDEKIAKWLAKWYKKGTYTKKTYTGYNRYKNYRGWTNYTRRTWTTYTKKNYAALNIANRQASKMSMFYFTNGGYASKGSAFYGSGWSRYDNHPKSYSLNTRPSNATASSLIKNGHSYCNARTYLSSHRWHHRQRDIYKDNYAKYGASRMAMEQNLRNYSNRSITEMRRTNQSLRYNQIHRHTSW